MKIQHMLKTAPDVSTKMIMEVQAAGNQATTVDLTKGGVNDDKLVADIRQRQGLLVVVSPARSCRPAKPGFCSIS